MAVTPGVGIVLSGTAPAMTLMSGAMLAFDEMGVDFEVISTTGAGALIGMLYLAPRGASRTKALEELPNLFMSDWLYKVCPINVKIFHKYGALAQKFYSLRKSLPQIDVDAKDPAPFKRLVNDWLHVWATALTPPSLETSSKAFMSHVPLVEELVDFAKLEASQTRFYVNTFSLWTKRLRYFDNQGNKPGVGLVNTDIYNAVQAMFMLFEPVRIPGDLLTTGATRDPTALQAIWTHERGLKRVLTLDPVSDAAWRMPRGANDAFQLMLMNPVAALQELTLALYAVFEESLSESRLQLPRLDHIPVEIPPSEQATMWQWTHGNALKLQQIGYDGALPIARLLRNRDFDALSEFRYSRFVTEHASQVRSRQLLRIFTPMRERMAEIIHALDVDARPREGRA
jgi:NTE family protein